jgi:hypothetical protein
VGSGDNRPAATLFNSCATGRVSARSPSNCTGKNRLAAVDVSQTRLASLGFWTAHRTRK